jgi:hypothetical protein
MVDYAGRSTVQNLNRAFWAVDSGVGRAGGHTQIILIERPCPTRATTLGLCGSERLPVDQHQPLDRYGY